MVIRIDRVRFNAQFASLKKWQPAAARSLRRNMKLVGKDGVDEIRKTVQQPPPSDNPDITKGTRAQIAAQTSFQVTFTKRSAGAMFITRSRGLGNFIFGYNSKSFRHPVFGQGNAVKVTQEGRPYFGVVITKDVAKTLNKRMGDVIDDANRAIGAR